jgi:uncharacterized protein
MNSWSAPAALGSAEQTRGFIRSVYGWMFGGLMLTAMASLWVVVSPAMQQLVLRNPIVAFGLLFVELGLVMFLSFRAQHLSAGTGAALFLVYSLLNGLSLSAIFFVYTLGSIFTAFAVAAGMFAAMSVYGMVTKRDLTGWRTFLIMGLIGVVIASIVHMFWNNGALNFIISIVGVIVFTGLTAYDTQKLKTMATMSGPGTQNLAVLGALALYLDFINIFLFLLRLFGGRRD